MVCSKAIVHIGAKAISDVLTNQVLKFLLYLSNWSLQKTLLPLCHFQTPYFPCGFCEVEIALEFQVKWLRGGCDRGMFSYVPWQEPQMPPSSDSMPQRPQPPDWDICMLAWVGVTLSSMCLSCVEQIQLWKLVKSSIFEYIPMFGRILQNWVRFQMWVCLWCYHTQL